MGRKSKFSKEQKIEICKRYLDGSESISILAEEINAGKTTIERWIKIFKAYGESAFDEKPANESYTKEFKCKVVEEYLAGMAEGVKAGKIRQIGIANCFAWQLAEANAIAKENGWPEFVSVQNHYNLIMREEEREMNVYADERNIALTPYSALAAGRLSRRPGETSKRLEQDTYAKFKYDASADKDAKVIAKVSEIADARGVSMTEVSLAWLLTKVTSPIVGATKISHVEGAESAIDLKVTDDDIKALEELYEPHFLSGVMAQNTPAARTTEQVWIKNGKYAKQN